MESDLSTLVGALFLVLLALTLMTEFLEHSLKVPSQRRVVRNVNDRIREWWVIFILMFLMVPAGKAGVVTVAVICSFSALREFLTLTNTRLADSLALAAAFFFVLPVQYLAVVMGWDGFYSLFIPVYAFLCMPVLAALRGHAKAFLIRIAETQWSLMICVFCISHGAALLNFDLPNYTGKNLLLIVFLIVVVQSCDTIQYVYGAIWGKRHMAPELSSVKTWGGFVAGVSASSLFGALLFWITPFGVFGAMAMAAIISAAGFFGSLVMSAIKRDRRVRDWGPMMMVKGGFIDRLDTVIFSAPVFYYLIQTFYA